MIPEDVFNHLIYDGPLFNRPVAAWRVVALADREARKRKGAKYLPPMSTYLVSWLRAAQSD
jgi:hypothetical protein